MSKASAINRAWELWPDIDPKTVASMVSGGWEAATNELMARAERAEAERDDLELRLAEYLCDSTGGKLSKTGYTARTMIQHTEEYYAELHEAQLAEARARAERAEKAIRAALAFEAVLPAIATEPRRILTEALVTYQNGADHA